MGLIWRILGLPISKQAEILKNLPNAFRRATNDVCGILYKGFQRILMGNFGANDVRSSTKVPKGFPKETLV